MEMLADPVYTPVWADATWENDRMVERALRDFPRWHLWLVETQVRRIGPCDEWIGPRNLSGYGLVRGLRTVRAHRFRYLAEVGPIAYGLVLDHLCGNHACCRVEHLEPVTEEENLLRADLPLTLLSRNQSHKYRRLAPRSPHVADRHIAAALISLVSLDEALLRTAARKNSKSPYREVARAVLALNRE